MKTYKILAAVVVLVAAVVAAGSLPMTGNVASDRPSIADVPAGDVQEIAMDSFVVFADGKPHPQFSVKEITVTRGDRVRFLVNTTSGSHNINIDEFNVHAETPTGQVTVVEFVADRAGEFVYYCSMPGHRQNGHWGTLTVVEA
ncbi:MAG: cupredoxin domain-containing protein [Candidatus Aenigmarchaeota archaeon]|nr:cupredoxin domain-containing protein [Candidatus Aenigmarchaeota archaeon]